MKILAIESSCDETATAIVENGVTEICSVVASSKELHEKTGGVVPEIAARKQVEFIVPVLNGTFEQFKTKGFDPQKDIDAIAVTVGPGLIGSLVVGVESAKTLAFTWNKPLIAVNHLVGHIYANFINNNNITFPAIALLVSGGHTDLIKITDHGNYTYLGGTLDDAAGEAFDKTARILGLSRYLGGALLSKKALECSTSNLSQKLPRPMLDQHNYDFSFSGLKTAVKKLVDSNEPDVACIAHEFQEAVIDVLVTKTFRALLDNNIETLLVGGGVCANSKLRQQLISEAARYKINVHIPDVSLCTDNAVYIASAAFFNRHYADLSQVQANPSLGIMDKL